MRRRVGRGALRAATLRSGRTFSHMPATSTGVRCRSSSSFTTLQAKQQGEPHVGTEPRLSRVATDHQRDVPNLTWASSLGLGAAMPLM